MGYNIHRVAKSQTQLRQLSVHARAHTHTHTHTHIIHGNKHPESRGRHNGCPAAPSSGCSLEDDHFLLSQPSRLMQGSV